jgi:hypothetical protein
MEGGEDQISEPEDSESDAQVVELSEGAVKATRKLGHLRRGGRPSFQAALTGAEAVIHRVAAGTTRDPIRSWVSTQVLIRIPGVERPAIITLLSSDDRDSEALSAEAVSIARSMSRTDGDVIPSSGGLP